MKRRRGKQQEEQDKEGQKGMEKEKGMEEEVEKEDEEEVKVTLPQFSRILPVRITQCKQSVSQ